MPFLPEACELTGDVAGSLLTRAAMGCIPDVTDFSAATDTTAEASFPVL